MYAMKVKLSSHDQEVAFQELGLGYSKRPYLQRSVKMATRKDPLKVEEKKTQEWVSAWHMWLTSRHLKGGTAEIRFVMGSGRVWCI